MNRKTLLLHTAALAAALIATGPAGAQQPGRNANGCGNLPGYSALKSALTAATAAETSGLNNQMWGTIVDRDGIVCAVAFPAPVAARNGRAAASSPPRRQIRQTPSASILPPTATAPDSPLAWRSPQRIFFPRSSPVEVFSACRKAILCPPL